MEERQKGKIRVLHMMDRLEYGGVQSFVLNVYKEIDREKIQFDFLVTDNGNYDKIFKEMGSKIFLIPNIKKVGYFRYKKELDWFFKMHPEYQILHIHYSQLSSIISRIAKKNHVSNILSHSHSAGIQSNGVKAIIKKILGYRTCRYATKFFACSEKAAKFLFKNRANDAEIVKNGINLKDYSFDVVARKRIREKLKIPEEAKVIGHIGRMVKTKNHSFLIDIFRIFLEKDPNAHLLLVGDGPELSTLEEMVKKLGICDKVHFVGGKTNTNDYYSAMDYFVFPSISEGFGISLLEAQANGLKCFASDVVPSDTNVTKEVLFLSLSDPKEKWADVIYKTNSGRYDKKKAINDHGYDILDIANRIQKIYLSFDNFSSSKKKVLQYVPAYNFGGIETATYNFSRELKDKYDFVYLVERDLDSYNINKLKQIKAKVIRIPNMTKEGFFAHVKSIRNVFKNGNYDIVHVHDCDDRFFVMLFSKIYGVNKRIYHIHSQSVSGHRIKQILKKVGIKLNVLFSTDCLACSDMAAKAKKIKKYIPVGNGIVAEEFKFSQDMRDRIRKKYSIPGNAVVLLFVGRVEKVKNVSYLVDVIKKISAESKNKYYLLIVGDGKELENIKRKAENMNVIFTGRQRNLSPYYSAGDILCLPSFKEGFSIVSLEAQASGLVCLLTKKMPKTINVTDLVKFLSIAMGNMGSWVEEVLSFVPSVNKRKRYFKLIKSSKFSSSYVASQIDTVYEDLGGNFL